MLPQDERVARATIYEKNSRLLFEQWKHKASSGPVDHKNGVFVRDGVVCPQKWFSADIRPLFLLKEAYGGESDWDLISDHLCSDRKMSKLWTRIAQWAHGILHTDGQHIAPYSKYEATTFSENEDLKQIAVINVKKSGGRPVSDRDDLQAYAEYDRTELLRQLEACDPTVIVCGYTAYLLETILDCRFREIRNENLFYRIRLNGHEVLVLDYWHPSNQYPDLMNYCGLIDAYHFARKEQRSN